MPNNLTIEQVIAEMAEAPVHLAGLADRLTPSQLNIAQAPGEWSFAEVFAHLRASADAWGDAVHGALDGNPPAVARVGREALAWMKGSGFVGLEFGASLRTFTTKRSELVSRLAGLSPSDWTRSATVKRAGRLRQETVLSFAQRLAGHELRHRRELERLVKRLASTGTD